MSETENKYEIKPKLEKQFGNGFDKFDRKPFAEQLTKVITRYTPLYDEAFVLSLNGSWGSGKTAFLDMWKHYLENEEEPYQVISINAWETDFDEEPLIPIISALYNHVSSTSGLEELGNAMQEGLGATALSINDVVAHISGFNLRKVLTEVEEENRSLKDIGEDLYNEYSFKKKAYEALRVELQKYTETLNGKPLVIFVDELDRVRPDYAVKFLEAIKHIFSAKGVCFVIAIDKEQLEKSVKQLYGDIKFDNYYRRFITSEANLPEIKNIKLNAFFRALFDPFFNEESSLKFPIKKEEHNDIIEFASSLCKAHNFTAREIKCWFRSFSHFVAIETDAHKRISWINASMILIAVSMKNEELYRAIGADDVLPEALIGYACSLDYSWQQHNYFERTIIHVLMSFSLKDEGIFLDSLAAVYSKYKGSGTSNMGGEELIRHNEGLISDLAAYTSDFRHVNDVSYFKDLYGKIEMWNNL